MDAIVEQPRDSGSSQTSALFTMRNGIGTLASIPASESASASLPIPMEHNEPACPQFQLIEARWYQWYRDKLARQEQASYLRYQKCQSEWYERCERKNQVILDKSVWIATLIMELLHEKTERMKLEHKFNLCGALELIVYHARLNKMIASNEVSGIQDGLDRLAGTPAFVEALQGDTVARELALDDVTAHIAGIYNTVSKRASGNDLVITLYEDHYTKEECAVLAAFLRVQNGWLGGFQWVKVKMMGRTQC